MLVYVLGTSSIPACALLLGDFNGTKKYFHNVGPSTTLLDIGLICTYMDLVSSQWHQGALMKDTL